MIGATCVGLHEALMLSQLVEQRPTKLPMYRTYCARIGFLSAQLMQELKEYMYCCRITAAYLWCIRGSCIDIM